MEINSNELRTLENELMSLASNYQEVVSRHFQKSRNDLNKQVEHESIIVLSVVVISILFVALVIWLVSSRGIVSRLNYLMDAILSGSNEIIDMNKSDDEIGKLSNAIQTPMTGQRHLEFSNKTLEVIAESKDLKAILKQIILFYESENLDSICSVLLLDEERKHLTHGVAPSLPSFYSSGIDGLAIGPNAGPCGAAAYKNELTIVENISTNPLCKNFKELANRAGLKACWSQPILSSKGEVLGTFAVYYKTPKTPGEEELKLLKTLAYKAGFAIESNYQEKALKNQTAALKQSNQDLQNFASIASHDLKEPLRKIVAFSELLVERETNLSEQSRSYLERMQKSSLRMANFIDNLLKYSKVSIHKESVAPLELKEVLAYVTNDLEAQIAATHAQIKIAEMPRLNMSFHHAQQLLQNLISNALKFHKKDVPPIIHITSCFKYNEKVWEIRVEDNGIGFEEKYANRIFQMFERLQGRSAYEGTGIGLAICEKIVKLYAGTITTESKLGEGATFIIKLPEALKS
jgi:signal transduction histidine kinase